MHANILQYQQALTRYGRRRELNRILLLTPNEGLSQQHLREFEAAGIDAELFNKDGRGLFSGQSIEILDIHKLKDEMGDKTLSALVLPAAATLPRARRHLPTIQYRASSVGLRRWKRDGDAREKGRVGHRGDLAVPSPLCGRSRRQHPAHRPDSQPGPCHRNGQEPVRRALPVSQHLRTLAGAGLRQDAGDALQRPRWRPALCRRT